MKIWHLYPLAREISARLTPVLPAVPMKGQGISQEGQTPYSFRLYDFESEITAGYSIMLLYCSRLSKPVIIHTQPQILLRLTLRTMEC